MNDTKLEQYLERIASALEGIHEHLAGLVAATNGSTPEGLEGPSELDRAIEWVTETPEDQVVAELESYIRARTASIPANLKLPYDDYWFEKGLPEVVPAFLGPPGVPLKVAERQRRIQDTVHKVFEGEVKEREQDSVPGLTAACIAWASEKEFTNVTQTDVEQFLRERNIIQGADLSFQAVRQIWTETKVRLKENRARRR